MLHCRDKTYRDESDTRMLKIEVQSTGDGEIIRVFGRILLEHIDILKAHIAASGASARLDLQEVTLVELGVVRFLLNCEMNGVTLMHCPPYIREWIERERSQ